MCFGDFVGHVGDRSGFDFWHFLMFFVVFVGHVGDRLGFELQSMTPDPRDPRILRIPRIPGMNSKSCVFVVFYSNWGFS